MGLVSIEEAVLGFVRKVKADPGLSDLFRDALNTLEGVLDPQAHEATPPAVAPAEPPPPVTDPPADPVPPPAVAPAEPPPPVTDPPADPTPPPPVSPSPVG